MRNYHFLVFLAVWVLFRKFWAGEGVAYIRITSDDKSDICSCIANELLFGLRSR